MLILWGRDSSANVQKVAWLIGELGLEVDRKDVGGPFGGLDTSEYKALNPNQLIPTLQDGDVTVWESEAVLRYIGSKYGKAFFPEDPKARAEVDQWMCWNQSTWIPAIWPLFVTYMKTPVKLRDPDQILRLENSVNSVTAFIDDQLKSREFIAGDDLSLADFSFAAWLYRYYTLEVDWPERQALKQYYERLCSREAFVRHVHISYEFMRVPGAERPD